ncbi:hypothetical protein [Streptomyces fulvoviolaceus]|uniref:hypothetical protein n=1 Tax=Streptomyces fulvoviolaceus TaxID=285535 RepID=UPI0004C47CD4|nr:hypothetical protein [Streptomyces fulvoviolaceus]MCT9081458.1 hypothetical protein [Streptomyces fulvoviolaceus]
MPVNDPPTHSNEEDEGVLVLDAGEPTGSAYVSITTTPDGPALKASVPEGESGQALRTLNTVAGVAGSVIGPYLMAKALALLATASPWQFEGACLMLAALLPWVHLRIHPRHEH